MLASLPVVFSLMIQDKVKSFQALRSHQRHSWHVFLSQLGALVCNKSNYSDIPTSADDWKNGLQNLTPPCMGDSHWHLVIDDIRQSAFMQSPVTGKLSHSHDKKIHTPNELDLLFSSKNHDIKIRTGFKSGPDDWMFALISLQTMAGYQGSGHHGIARMNRGRSSRPVLGLARAKEGIGSRLKRDILMLRETREDTLDRFSYIYSNNGTSLVWLEPWDGKSSLSMKNLDLWFIEICRRRRLFVENEIICGYKETNKARIDAKELNGCTGDAWTPVFTNDKIKKSLTIKGKGFSYNLLCDIMFDDKYYLPAALKFTRSEGNETNEEWNLVAQGIAGGNCKTDGWHERIVPVPGKMGKMVFRVGNQQQRVSVGTVARKQIDEISRITEALKKALAEITSKEKEKENGGSIGEQRKRHYEQRKRHFINKLDHYADRIFFDNLWARYDDNSEDHDKNSQEFVKKLDRYAQQLLGEAGKTWPCPSIKRQRRQAMADYVYKGCTRKEFDFLKPPKRSAAANLHHG